MYEAYLKNEARTRSLWVRLSDEGELTYNFEPSEETQHDPSPVSP